MRARNVRLSGAIAASLLAAGCGTEFTGDPDVPIASPDVNVEVNVEGPAVDVIQETTVDQVVVNGEDGDQVVICHIPPGHPETASTITVNPSALVAHLNHGDSLGACECASDADCDDARFCNGYEVCLAGACEPGDNPCDEGEECDETADACVECRENADCDDGLFCNGAESCVAGVCEDGVEPCDLFCDENNDLCIECLSDSDCGEGVTCADGECTASGCTSDADCDDELFCNGAEACSVNGECVTSTDPCAGTDTPFCIEAESTCVECVTDSDCAVDEECNCSVCIALPICPSGWIHNSASNHCYRLTAPLLTWHQAEEEAVAAGAHLVTINDASENEWVLNTFWYIGGATDEMPLLWIGFTDQFTEGHFEWIGEVVDPGDGWDGGWWEEGNPTSTSYTNWHSADDNTGLQDYVQMFTLHESPLTPGVWADMETDDHETSGVIERPSNW